VLKINPACSASVRLGLGLCYYKLGKPDIAKKCFERAIELDNTNVEAMVSLSILEMNTGGPKAVARAMNLLKSAYELNPNNSMVLNYLANHFFYKKDYKKVIDLAKSAYHKTNVDKIKAESCYHIARAHHAMGDYQNAFSFYYPAVQHWPEFTLAQYGLGQMYIQRGIIYITIMIIITIYICYNIILLGEPEKALSCFENVLASHPGDHKTLKILGSLYSETGKKERAYLSLKRVTESYPNGNLLLLLSLNLIYLRLRRGSMGRISRTHSRQ
jgi:RNA polymerase-associated protein CTR9